jgi:hypothetical protein
VKVRFMVLNEVAGSCVNSFRKPELQWWVDDIVPDRPCNCMPDIAQKLYVTMIDSNLVGSIPEEKIIFIITKYVVFLDA